jgi:AcrR family transcriptional regulator
MTVSKKQQLLDAALTLFVDNGIHGTSTASIAKAAKVANGTLFHHFPSKDALVHTLYLAVKQELSQQITPGNLTTGTIEQHAKQIWDNAIDWSVDNPNKLQFFKQIMFSQVLSPQLQAEMMAQELGFLEQLITAGQQQNLLAQYPIALMLDNCHGQFISASSFFIENPTLVNDVAHRDAAFKMFWGALS